MACHSVVRAGDVLARPQAEALLGQLDAVDLRSHCPHGRPVLLRLPLSELERRFGRS
jgi:DNA mismatch repair protein MutL